LVRRNRLRLMNMFWLRIQIRAAKANLEVHLKASLVLVLTNGYTQLDMRRNQTLDRETLEAALIGFEHKKAEIVGRIAEIRARLGAKVSEDSVVESQPKARRKRRRMSAAARKRIGDAARAR
jgi:hypothetical protein